MIAISFMDVSFADNPNQVGLYKPEAQAKDHTRKTLRSRFKLVS